MSPDRADPAVVREVLRDVLSELMPELAAAVPPPPVAAVHRPSSWRAAAQEGTVSEVSITSDAELDAFVQRLLHLFESPRDRAAIRAGQLRFTLGNAAAPNPATATVRRIDDGAVGERIVREAAAAGSRLVLGPRAVLTPMARDAARSLGVTIEKERRC